MSRFLLFFLPAFFFRCSSNQTGNTNRTVNPTTSTYPIQRLSIDNSEDDGWGADIRLSLTEVTSTDSLTYYKAISSYEGKNVGIEFILPNTKPGIKNPPTQILEIKTCGENSDNLLALLSNLYKLKDDTARHFIASAKLAFVDLNEFAKAKFGKDAISQTDIKEMKLFFETEDPEDHAELYVNINEKEHWLEIREKDESYRTQVIKFLTVK